MDKLYMSTHTCIMDKFKMSMVLQVFKSFKLNQGFIPCEESEAEIAYLVVYSESNVCNWLTVCGSHWSNNAYEAANDPLGLSKIFRMNTIQFIADNNGSALIELSDKFGNSAGTKIIGTLILNQYNSTNIKEEIWSEFLKPLTDKAEFDKFINSLYNSEMDVVSQLSSLLHIQNEQLLADINSEFRSCDYTRLYFKKFPDDTKKLTIKSAFKRIYGETLAPLGFAWAKTKEPCFIRVINEEILHIVGIHDMKPDFIVPFGGATTVYRADLMLNKTYRDTANWLPNVRQFWGWTHTDSDEAPDPRIGSKFHYLKKSPDSIECTISAALNETIRWILPMLSSVQSLQNFPEYFEKCHNTLLPFCRIPLKTTDSGNFKADAVIRYLLGDIAPQFEQYSIEVAKRQEASTAFQPNINASENIQYLRDHAKARNEAIRQSVLLFENKQEVKQQTLAELQRRKKANLETLHIYGVI